MFSYMRTLEIESRVDLDEEVNGDDELADKDEPARRIITKGDF